MDLTENINEAVRVLTEQPMFAVTAERFIILNEIKSEYKDLPQPKRFAKFVSALLSRVSTPLEAYDLIAGRCVNRSLTDAEEQAFQQFIKHPDYPTHMTMFSSGHCTYSWDMVVESGLPGMRQKAVCRLATERDADKIIFLESMIEIYDAIKNYLLRYAAAAAQQGMDEMRLALTKAATQKPDSFRVALQLLWVITLINCAYISENPTLTVGRLDQILYPLYLADIKAGTLTRETAADLITDYYCKHNLIMGRGEHQVGDETNSTTFKRILNFDAPQYLLLAGTDPNGASAVNELTELFAECIIPQFKNPVVVVRYFKDLNTQHPTLWDTLTQKSLQSASMMYYNDDNMLATYHRLGIPMEDARNYVHFGCNWPSLGDQSAWMQGAPRALKYGTATKEERAELSKSCIRMNTEHGWPEDLMIVLHQLSERENITIDDVYEGFFARMEDFVERKLAYFALELEVRKRRPAALLSFTDCFTKDSILKAECYSASAKYHFGLQSFQMFATVCDSIIVIHQLVIKEKKLTLKELLTAVDANFEGYPEILAMCRNVEKYGSDSQLSNDHAYRLSHTASNLVIEKSRHYLQNMGLFLTPCIQSDTWHLKNGETYGATPDGRTAHTPFSQNTRPSNGACINGITAMFNAMLHLPSDGLLSGALNLDINPAEFAGAQGQKIFAALLGTYFNHGGLHAQVTCADVKDLIDAQQHPYLHRDLRVRVTGYSGVFVDICKRLQDDIIERLK